MIETEYPEADQTPIWGFIVHSEQVRRLYIPVTAFANLTATALAPGLTTFTMRAMKMALPLYATLPGDSIAQGVRYSSSVVTSHFSSWAASQFYTASASDLAFS